MIMILIIILLIISVTIDGYININNNRQYIKLKVVDNNLIEDGVTLSSLPNINNDAEWLGKSIKKWLDEEYMILPIHDKIGNVVTNIYSNSRNNNVNDLGDMLMAIGTELESVDLDKAFVNAFDIANKASDLLMIRMDRELCECAGDMSSFKNNDYVNVKLSSSSSSTKPMPIININKNKIVKLSQKLSSEFPRYQLLREFLDDDDDVTWDDVHVIIALVLGFRVNNIDNSFKQNNDYAPIGWDDLDNVPDLSHHDSFIQDRLSRDMPDEEEAVDIVIETIIGAEMLKIMKANAKDNTLRKILISKWLYVHGFLTNTDFPLKSKVQDYPLHLTRDDD